MKNSTRRVNTANIKIPIQALNIKQHNKGKNVWSIKRNPKKESHGISGWIY